MANLDHTATVTPLDKRSGGVHSIERAFKDGDPPPDDRPVMANTANKLLRALAVCVAG